jgi:hypothetical protein
MAFIGRVKTWLVLFLVAAWLLTGCTGRKEAARQPTSAGTTTRRGNQRLQITPDNTLVGKVIRADPVGRFVVLNFPIGRGPVVDQHLNVYRLGGKVGEVKVTNWQLRENVVADIVAGEAQVGDQVSDK